MTICSRLPQRLALIALVITGCLAASRQLHAQQLRLPVGPIDSATLQNNLQLIEYVIADDRPRAAMLFTQLLARESDIEPAMVLQIRYLHASAHANQPAMLAAYRSLARLRGGEFVSAMPRLLLGAGQVNEALTMARAWKPAPGTPSRPFKEEIESIVARLRGDAPAALTAARAMRRYPGNERNYFAVGLELGALALVVKPDAPGAAPLAALVDSALSSLPRGYRVDPVAVYGNYGDALLAAGHVALSHQAYRRALAVLDSTAPSAAARGAMATDSIRLMRGRLQLALGRYSDARALLLAKSLRRDAREQSRQGWLALAALRMGDTVAAQRLDAALAADTSTPLRGATAMARATIAEATGKPTVAADLMLSARESIDLRTMLGLWMLPKAVTDPRVVAWMRGR